MKNSVVFLFFTVLFIGLNSCKDKSAVATTEKSTQPQTGDKKTKESSTQTSVPVYRYVIAPNGLSLRVSESPDSKKIAGMPLGSKVILVTETTKSPLEIEQIKGAMVHIRYKGQVGYAFSGYLSPIHLIEEDQTIKDYVVDLKTVYPEISFESKPNDPNFHDGTTDAFTLPASSWHEAYYLATAIYKSPKTLEFPSPSGPNQEHTEDPEKPDEVWSSGLTITRESNTLKKIQYDYRAEGFGYGFTIVREAEKLFRIEYLGFVD